MPSCYFLHGNFTVRHTFIGTSPKKQKSNQKVTLTVFSEYKRFNRKHSIR